jgi:hypothetical protein
MSPPQQVPRRKAARVPLEKHLAATRKDAGWWHFPLSAKALAAEHHASFTTASFPIQFSVGMRFISETIPFLLFQKSNANSRILSLYA